MKNIKIQWLVTNPTLWLLCLCFLGMQTSICAQKQKVWLDADTGNEMDDIYALARILEDTSVEVIGLSSAHFNNADLVVFDADKVESKSTIEEPRVYPEGIRLVVVNGVVVVDNGVHSGKRPGKVLRRN